MARTRDLGPNAPITEALIDIFVSLPKSASLDQLRAMHDGIKDAYPEMQTRRRFQGMFQISEGSVQSHAQALGADGFFFQSPDRLDVLQFRMDGFTANRLAPYRGYDELRDRTVEYWARYNAGVSPESVLAVGLRYINKIEVPMGFELSDYFSIAPELPEGFVHLVDFSYSTAFPDPASGALAQVLLARDATSPPSATRVVCALEIGAQRQISRRLVQDELIRVLEELRSVKNRIFFGSVTDKCVEGLAGGVKWQA